MAKKEKLARVRYIKGRKKKLGRWDDDEQFYVEVLDNGEWSYHTGEPLVHSKEDPDDEANFIHFSFVKALIRMAQEGYKFEKLTW